MESSRSLDEFCTDLRYISETLIINSSILTLRLQFSCYNLCPKTQAITAHALEKDSSN